MKPNVLQKRSHSNLRFTIYDLGDEPRMSLVTSSATFELNRAAGGVAVHRIASHCVANGDAEVTQAGLQINGLRGLRRLGSLAFVFSAKRSTQMRREEN
jgi:hypothetical protein